MMCKILDTLVNGTVTATCETSAHRRQAGARGGFAMEAGSHRLGLYSQGVVPSFDVELPVIRL
jgi:hypothetical protein